jgi:hypothetical protein
MLNEETLFDGLPLKVTSYEVGSAFVTEVEDESGDSPVVRGIAPTPDESFRAAMRSLSRRLLHNQWLCLTVGG